jgi:Mo-co oxidoreductase dimerisation domain
MDAGRTRVTGVAWTGEGTIQQVEVSIDGGRTWQQARFTSEPHVGTWRQWEADVVIRSAGDQRVRARATDTAGHIQPERAAPNPGGYGNNSIHEVLFHAR